MVQQIILRYLSAPIEFQKKNGMIVTQEITTAIISETNIAKPNV